MWIANAVMTFLCQVGSGGSGLSASVSAWQTRDCWTGEKMMGGCLGCRARLAIQAAFGESRKVVSVPAREILLGGGDIHCMSMQQPAGVPAAGL